MSSSPVILVSGLPRSGTSMMMRALEAGGIPPLTDGRRKPDPDNPRGYYEYEPIKRVRHDASWLGDARGKAVKAIYMLLYDLPAEYRYRVIFMTRRLDEVIASQDAMLKRSGQEGAAMDAGAVRRIFTAHLDKVKDWLARQPNFEVLYVHYNALIDQPDAWLQRVNTFLGGGLDVPAMVGVVEPALYRQRNANATDVRSAD